MRPASACLFVLIAAASAAYAARAEASDWTANWNVGVATDEVKRGVSQAGGRPTAFGGIDIDVEGAYAGLWATGVKRQPPPANGASRGRAPDAAELNLYAGWRSAWVGYDVDLGGQTFTDTASADGARTDYAEVFAKVHRGIGPISAGAALYLSPRARDLAPHSPGKVGASAYAELNAAWALDRKWTLTAALGQTLVDIAHGTLADKQTRSTQLTLICAYAIDDHWTLQLKLQDASGKLEREMGARASGGRLGAALTGSF